jgi:outer membrane protein assembly factor BamB
MAVIVLCRYVPPFIEGASSQFWYVPVFFPMVASALMLIWWLAGSRATGREKLIGFFGVLVALTLTVLLSHASMRGLITTYLTLPLGMVGLGFGAYLNSRKQPKPRVTGVLICSVIAMSITLLLRNEGINGAYAFDLKSRWSASADDVTWVTAKASPSLVPSTGPAVDAAIAAAEWPGFHGADRMGHTKAPKLATDWNANPPKLLWKKTVGTGWSSFAVAGSFAFTQEQRGANEVTVCYDVATGGELWSQQREARFDEPMGGPGPRATPTLADGSVFTVSASGVLQRLKASTGEVVWQQDFKKLADREPPMWGYASSPLVTHSLVIIFAGGAGDKGVMAFDAATGKPRWSVACGPESYSSPQLSKVLGEEMVLMLTNDGLLLLDPASGKVRLNYEWKFQGYRALQPTVIGDDVVLLPTPMSEGTRAIRLSKKGEQLAAEELWTSKNMKTDFTELLTHKGYLYGIDGSMFSCVDLKTGNRVWKDGRYGKGEAVLLESSDQILITAEDGRVVLLQADPSGHKELASIKALSGKTWNHPVVVGDKLLVRNGSEAACFALPVAP